MEIRSEQPNPLRAAQARIDEAQGDALRRAREQNREAARPVRADGDDKAVDRAQQARIQAARRKEARIDAAEGQGARPSADRVELSPSARALLEARDVGALGATDPGQLARLREIIAEGGLFTQERIEQAARRLLSSEG